MQCCGAHLSTASSCCKRRCEAAARNELHGQQVASPAVTAGRPDIMTAVFGGPQSLLCDPNPASPANSEAARLYGENRCESVPLHAASASFTCHSQCAQVYNLQDVIFAPTSGGRTLAHVPACLRLYVHLRFPDGVAAPCWTGAAASPRAAGSVTSQGSACAQARVQPAGEGGRGGELDGRGRAGAGRARGRQAGQARQGPARQGRARQVSAAPRGRAPARRRLLAGVGCRRCHEHPAALGGG